MSKEENDCVKKTEPHPFGNVPSAMNTGAQLVLPTGIRLGGNVPPIFPYESEQRNVTSQRIPGRTFPSFPYAADRRIPHAQNQLEQQTQPKHDPTTNYSDDPIVIVRRASRKLQDPEKAKLRKDKFMDMKKHFITLYLTLATEDSKVEVCSDLTAIDVEVKDKYQEFDLQTLFNKNLVQRRINCLTQTLGILEKYASNLIKPNRPAFWRTVKFTSSLVKTYLENVQGSHDILKQMGYAKPITDGLTFPDDIKVPDVERIKILASDLFLAKYEVDELVHDRHPYLQIRPAGALPSEGSVKRSLETGKTKVSGSEPGTSESESEYEDAEDGLATAEPKLPVSPPNVSNPQTPEISHEVDDRQCFVCGESNVEYSCDDCKDFFCSNCVKIWHKKRADHKTKKMVLSRTRATEIRSDGIVRPPTVQTKQPKPTPRLKKPVPVPRKRIPIGTKPISTNVPSRQNVLDELPPPIMARRTVQYPTRSVSRETVTESTPKPQNEREVKRPPPFDYPFLLNEDPLPPMSSNEPRLDDENLYQSLKMPSEHIYEAMTDLNRGDKVPEEVPPPIPPKPKSSSAPSEALSCPHCFCLNENNSVRCMVCGTKLRESEEVPAKSGPVDNSAVNLPVQSLRNLNLSPRIPTNSPSQLPGNFYEAISSSNASRMPASASGVGVPGSATSTNSTAKWECEHCTFHNDMGTNICAVCSKTSDKIKPIENETHRVSLHPNSPPSILKLQEQELHSYRSKSPLLSGTQPGFIKMQQMEVESILKESPTNYLPPWNQTAFQMQAPQETFSQPKFSDPPLISPSFYTSGFSKREQGLSPRVYSPVHEIQRIKEEGQKFVQLLKRAETLGFAPDELNIACTLHENDEDPIHWLQNEWFNRMVQVMRTFANISTNENLGNLSPQEAREALIEHTGQVEEACQQCIADRKKKLNEVMDSGIYVRTDVIKSLDENDGDVTEAIQQLQRMTFEPMLERIKNSCVSENDAVDNIPLRNSARRNSPSQNDDIFDAIVSNKEIDMDRRIRVMFAEKGFQSWGRAKTAIKLIDMEFPVVDSIEAAKANGDLERSIQYLQRECILCGDTTAENHMVTMLNCQCRFCKTCVSEYFNVVIHEQNIMRLVCPQCSEPTNLEDDAVATEYFNNLDILIRLSVDTETHDLFQRKLRDRTLMKEPNFRWCSHCSSGFINEQPEVLKMACPNCKKYSCFQCKKQWEDQHEGISCERFAAWKEANDPEAQANGLAAHLKQNGIECPNCTFRYDLAKGGCMHFKCGQCSHEFCSGCYKPFRNNQHCNVSPECARRGLHAHHPRDCLFYLRDRSPDELKKLLDDHNVEYNTERPQRDALGIENQGLEVEEEVQGAAAAVDNGRCKVMEQRESGAGLEDVECGRETPEGYAGLCRLHFTEYLVERINSNLIDPVGILSTEELNAVLKRNDIQPPAKGNREKDAAYRTRLVQFLQEKLPLPRKSPRRRVLDVDEQPQPQPQDNLRVVDLEEEDWPQNELDGYISEASDERLYYSDAEESD